MIQKIISFTKKTLSIVVFMAVAMVFFVSCGKTETDNSYAVSGYIYDENGLAVEGVDVKSEIGTVQTDESGKFVFEGVTTGLILEPSKDGYFFPETSKMVTGATTDANFTAYQYYTASGVVLNSKNVGVQNALVTLNSLVGTYYSVTDEEGRFSADGIAGEAELSCVSEDFEYFFPVKTSITNPDVKLNITKTDLTIQFNFDSKNIDFSDITIKINGEVQNFNEASPVFEDVKYNSRVEIESDKYVFSMRTFIVEEVNQVETIDVYKLYNVDGIVKSGDTFIENAEIYLNGKKLQKTTDEFGNFSVNELFSTNEISVKFGTLEFEAQTVTNANNAETLEFNGTKSINIQFIFDLNSEEIVFPAADVSSLGGGIYKVKGLTLGETVEFTCENYHLSDNSVEVANIDFYTVFAELYYSASIRTKDDVPATILLDGEPQTEFDGRVEGLFGTHSVTATLENYKFETVQINKDSHDVELNYELIYNVTINITSGEFALAGAKATYILDGVRNSVTSDESGQVTLYGLRGNVQVNITCIGYDDTRLEVSESGTESVNLTYSVTGEVKTAGGIAVEGATVSAGAVTATTGADGTYTLSNLTGSVSISAALEFYNFGEARQNITKQTTVDFSGTYTIKGVLSGEESVAGYKVCLIDAATIQPAKDDYVVAENGEYSFDGLTGTYFLYTTDSHGTLSNFKPNSYTVSLGGDGYDFNLSGFSVSGHVTTGAGHPVVGANVYAGSESTRTDAEGRYEFPLLAGETTISVELKGYSFPGNIIVSDDRDDADFDGTFSVEGTVKVGSEAVSGVQIYSGESLLGSTGEDGLFTVSGLSGEVSLKFEKDGYHFENEVSVDKYQVLSVTCKLVASIEVKTGEIEVSGYKIYVNGTLRTSVEGSTTELTLDFGDTLTFEKQGYTIASVVVTEPKTYTVQATYTVSGKVLSGTVAVSGVQVSANGKSVATGADGTFTLAELSGETSLLFQKDGFNFAGEQSVSGYTASLEIQATYTVRGKIVFGSGAMSGVTVTLVGTENTKTTGTTGEFEFENVSGNFSLTFEKEGYTFDAVQSGFGTEQIVVNAYFTVSGRVVSGNIGVVGAEIVVSFLGSAKSPEYYQSGVNGEFKIEGLSGSVTIIISKEMYTSMQFDSISDYTGLLSANLKYSVSFEFDTTGISIEASNGKTYNTGSSTTFTTPREFEGEVTFQLKKSHTSFSVNNIRTTGPNEFRNITSSVAYNDVSGRVMIDGTDIPVEGISVYAGSESNTVKTDANGYFKFEIGVAGKVGINEYGYKALITSSIKDDGALPTFSMPQKDFFIYLYNKSVGNLDESASVQIYGSGEVTTSAGSIAGTQTVKSSFKRDNRGTSIKQNLNYGAPKAGVDPRVALVVIYDSSDGSYKYKKVTGDSISSDYTANYGSLESSNKNYFKTTYGAYPEEYSAYIINSETVKLESFKKTGDDFEIKVSLSGQTNYQKQITNLSPGSVFNNFKSISHTYTINKAGWFKSLYTDETYNITQKDIPVLGTMDVDVYSKITYTYYTDKPNIKVPDVDFNNLQKSLTYENSTGLISNYKKLDVITNLIGERR